MVHCEAGSDDDRRDILILDYEKRRAFPNLQNSRWFQNVLVFGSKERECPTCGSCLGEGGEESRFEVSRRLFKKESVFLFLFRVRCVFSMWGTKCDGVSPWVAGKHCWVKQGRGCWMLRERDFFFYYLN